MKRILLSLFCVLIIFGTGCQTRSIPVSVSMTPPPSSTPSPTPTPIKTTLPEPTPTPTPGLVEATVVVAGDLLCLSAQISNAYHGGSYSFQECFELIKSNISAADLAIGNLETLVATGHQITQPNPKDDKASTPDAPAEAPASGPAIGPEAAPSPTKRPSPRINAPEEFLTALQGSGFDVLTTANNHVFDYREDGIIKTLKKLDEYNFAHTGAYAQETDKTPLILDVNGIHIAVLAYTDILNHRPGSGSAYMIDRYDKKLVASDIAAAKAADTDYVIVCIHWGTEHTHKPNRTQRKIAAQIADAGADIIFGSHPHCTQPFEMIETDRGDVPVLYSLGNFISSMGQTMHKDGVLVKLTLQKDPFSNETSLISVKYTPTLCASTSMAGYVIHPTDAISISQSDMAQALTKSRERTISILTEDVAAAE